MSSAIGQQSQRDVRTTSAEWSTPSKSSKNGKSKRTRQMNNFHVMALDQVDEGTVETESPTVNSTSASEISSKASKDSEPPLLDFIGTACFASAWFTSCFPCAVVDINDRDCNVVDKLSRASAMNVMYSTHVEPERPTEIQVPSSSSGDHDGQYLYHQVGVGPSTMDDSQIMHGKDHLRSLRRNRSYLSDEEEEDGDFESERDMDSVSLSDGHDEHSSLQQLPLDDLVTDELNDEQVSELAPSAPDTKNGSQPRRKFNFRPKSIRFGKRNKQE